MKQRTGWIILAVRASGIILFALIHRREGNHQHKPVAARATVTTSDPAREGPPNSEATRIPAHYEAAPYVNALEATLPPQKFDGQIRAVYQAAREIPQIIAQLPCYCYRDRGMGHKSLHSCFEDDHAAHCAVCTNEALMAYRLQKQGLAPKQIRERIIQ